MTSSAIASVTLLIVSCDSSVPSVAARWCWMSRMVIPPAYRLTIMSSSPPIRRVPLGTRREAKLELRSRGWASRTSRTSVPTVFGLVPLHEFPLPCPARSPRS